MQPHPVVMASTSNHVHAGAVTQQHHFWSSILDTLILFGQAPGEPAVQHHASAFRLAAWQTFALHLTHMIEEADAAVNEGQEGVSVPWRSQAKQAAWVKLLERLLQAPFDMLSQPHNAALVRFLAVACAVMRMDSVQCVLVLWCCKNC